MGNQFEADQNLAASITLAASKQTYYTVRFLVDRGRMSAAYQTYAYFRWVDDRLDQGQAPDSARIAFAERQNALMESLYRGESPDGLSAEERMLAELVQDDREKDSGLQAYVRNMMAVMVFDAYRRGRLISQAELAEYTRWLATAVTEAMHYFIGHDCASPKTELRYVAVTAAHIVHMLRDTREDCAAGYVNIPREYLAHHGIGPEDTDSAPYRAWVQGRVRLARDCFKAGESYLAQVESLRCRLAGYAYMARFQGVLDAIEANGYRLPAGYPERRRPGTALRMGWSVLSLALSVPRPGAAPRVLPEA